MAEIDPTSIREAVRAIRLGTPPDVRGGENGFVLERAPDFDRMHELLDPLVEAHGVGPVVDALRPHRAEPDLAEALFFVCWQNDHNLLTAFTEDEIVEAAGQQLLEFAEDRVTDTRGLLHWGWSADEQAFAILLELVELVPMDNRILWMIGDGPIGHALENPEYRKQDYPYGTP